MSQRRDVHSFAEPLSVRVVHCSLDLEVDFQQRELRGTASLRIERADPQSPLILDSRDLRIEEIRAGRTDTEILLLEPVSYRLGERDPILGSSITIDLPDNADLVSIRYRTGQSATGLQWLTREQTADRTDPFLFTQSQSIHARSWIPIQDSPGIRFTYDAHIRVPAGLLALMSAERKTVRSDVHLFVMKHAIPAYLVALAVGKLDYRELGPRTGIYAEPSLLPIAAREFADTERLVEAVEGLYGPYRWGRYELLILPPSFPFGGMENPVVTFATPTVIAGDKSLVSLVSHELAHSWSGNLVTNATWSDFWLNEGFTTYIENRIQEAVYGREQALMEQVIDRRELEHELAEFAPRDQILHIDLSGRDPDDGVTRIPYIKGAALLRQMEGEFGRAAFDEFLRRYFDHFAFQSITTDEAVQFLRAELLDRDPARAANIPIQEWIFESGLPSGSVVPQSEKLAEVANLAKAWESGALPSEQLGLTEWNTQQWLEFLQVLSKPFDLEKLTDLDKTAGLTATGNYEVLQQWLLIAIEGDYRPAYDRLATFLLQVGRMKLIKPLYAALVQTPSGSVLAQEIYAKARSGYHPIAQMAIDKIMLPASNREH